MDLYTIYNSPIDYPNTYVCRRFEVINVPIAKEIFMIDTDLDKIRNELLNMGFFVIPRDKSDDENIVETWL